MARHDPKRPRAQAPTPPQASGAIQKARDEREAYQREREGVEKSSILRGLMILALLALVFSLWRAGLDRAFYSGWWRQW